MGDDARELAAEEFAPGAHKDSWCNPPTNGPIERMIARLTTGKLVSAKKAGQVITKSVIGPNDV